MAVATIPNRPAGTDPRSIAAILANWDAITAEMNGNLDASNMAASAKPATLKGDYRTIADATSAYASTSSSGVNILQYGGGIIASGGNVSFPALVPILAADFAIAALTAKLRLRAAMVTNATSSTRTFTFGLYPVSAAGGGAGVLTVTLGAVVAGSTVAMTPGPSFSSPPLVGADFSLPADGLYALGVSLNGAPVANSFGSMMARLEAHHV